jgi:large subunit ribosomal protein L24
MKIEKSVTKQPRKQRLAKYHARIHSMKASLNIHLSKDLKKNLKKNALMAKKGDKVKVVRGDFRKREGKIIDVDTKEGRIYVEGIIRKKQGGKEVPAAIQPSNCILTVWNSPKMKIKRTKKRAVPTQMASKSAAQSQTSGATQIPKKITPQNQTVPSAVQAGQNQPVSKPIQSGQNLAVQKPVQINPNIPKPQVKV